MAISKVILNGSTLMDATSATATTDDIIAPKTAMLADGVVATGIGTTPSGTKQISITENGTTTENVTNYANAEITVDVPVGVGEWTTNGIADCTEPNGAILVNASKIGRYAFCGKPITSVEAQNVTSVGEKAFLDCTALESIKLPNLISTGAQIFENTAIKKINLPKLKSGQSYIFQKCNSLKIAVFPSIQNMGYMQFGINLNSACTSLEKVDIGENINQINSLEYAYCTAFTVFVLRKKSVVKLINREAFRDTPFASGGSGGTIYIPKALYDHLGDGTEYDYKAATNWSTIDGYGTITWAQIEGSIYETQYADGTPIPTT